ncbi:MAG: hypothetical protein AAB805_01015 [Patescibacteria group bacterium]
MKTVLSYAHTYEGFHREYARIVFAMFVALFLIMLLSYGYFLKSAAFSAARWENGQVTLAALSSEVSELETAYLARIQSLGMEKANALGLRETKSSVFVERGSDRGLTFANSARGGSQ